MKPVLISWEEAEKYVYHSNTLLVDLREPEAYETGHLTGAWNIPYEQWESYEKQMENYERVIFYCDHGNHSLRAARKLAGTGKQAASVAGGYVERNRKRR